MRTLAPDIDPVRFEVIRNALLAITEEMGATLRRAAYSTNLSLSDAGNYFIAFHATSRQPFEPIPDAPYAIGGHHFSNGATWIEQLTRALHQPTSGKPAFRSPGNFTNYAAARRTMVRARDSSRGRLATMQARFRRPSVFGACRTSRP